MSDELGFPTAVVIGLWLNSAQGGSVTCTDAANAIETITNQVDLLVEMTESMPSRSSWIDLVTIVKGLSLPVAVGLPIDGDPAGVPTQVLRGIERTSGVVALTRELLLSQNVNSEWEVSLAANTVIHHDLNQAKRLLVEQIARSTEQLRAGELIGDEAEIAETLANFRTMHLPPQISKRSIEALEMAARVSIVASGAITKSMAVHSPSIDRHRLRNLEALIQESRNVLQSVVFN